MCLVKGTLQKRFIVSNDPNFPLDEMVNPTFTNVGASSVYIDEELILSGESFKIDAPGVVLSGTIAIQFVSQIKSERRLAVRYVSPSI